MEKNIPPLYTSATSEDGDSYGYSILFHLFRHDRREDAVYTHLIPFYFHETDQDGEGFTLIPPVYFERKAPFEEDLYFPLWGEKKRGSRKDHYPLFPLLLYPIIPLARYSTFEEAPDRFESSLFPLFDYTSDGGRGRLRVLDLLGLVHLFDLTWGVPVREEEDPKGGSFSLLNVLNTVRLAGGGDLGGYRDFQLLSLLSSEKLSLFQYHWKKGEEEEGYTVLFPFYWRLKDEQKEALHFWPLYGQERARSGLRKDFLLYPFFRWERFEEEGLWKVDCPWPLVRIMRKADGDHENRFLPFFMESQSEGRNLWMLPPFYAKYTTHEGYSRKFYTPLLSTYTDLPAKEDGVDLLYPLISHQRSPERSHDRFWPLYHLTFEQNAHLMEITPLFWSYRNEEEYAFDLLFPLYAHIGFREDDHTYSLLPVFKLIMDRPSRSMPGRFQADLLWPLMGYGRQGEERTAWLFPLFNHHQDVDYVRWGFLFDLFDMRVEKSRKTFTFLWFIPISWGGEEEQEREE
jgi:hypothetical protein